jgi:hypothetical protein
MYKNKPQKITFPESLKTLYRVCTFTKVHVKGAL